MISVIKITILFISFMPTALKRIAFASKMPMEEPYHGERNDLRDSLSSTLNLHTEWTGPPCNKDQSRWIGITCSNSHVVGISLEGVQLTGSLPPTTLQSVTYLANLSLGNNALHGDLPTLHGLDHLRIISLSQNRFSGPIPMEYLALSSLSWLDLQDNLLKGTILPFEQQSLTMFNVSYNFLRGKIPETSVLQRFPNSSYSHNLELCGKPLDALCPEPPSPVVPVVPPSAGPSPLPSSRTKVFGVWGLVLVVVGAVMVLSMLFLFCFYCYKRYHKKATKEVDYSGDYSSEHVTKKARILASEGKPEKFSLEFFDKEKAAFDLDDLLRSSAEVIGKGTLGTTYKTTLDSGLVVVVKRLMDLVGVGRKEFVQQMQLLGRMRHQNLVEMMAFYFSKDEKLIVYEYVADGSLFQLLHDNRGEGRLPLKWAARLSIAKGIARGLAYLHNSFPPQKVPHGNLKSSNVLILHNNHCYQSKLTDFGFLPLLPSSQQTQKLTIKNVPEFSEGKKLTQKTDIYCLGLILLEILTGQVPEIEDDLPDWVSSAVRNDWLTDVLDLEIVADKESHADILKLTEIALECTAFEPERRPQVTQLVKRIEDIKKETNQDMS